MLFRLGCCLFMLGAQYGSDVDETICAYFSFPAGEISGTESTGKAIKTLFANFILAGGAYACVQY